MAHNKCYAYLNPSCPIGYCKYLKLDRACIANNMEYSNHPLFAIVEVLMDIDISIQQILSKTQFTLSSRQQHTFFMKSSFPYITKFSPKHIKTFYFFHRAYFFVAQTSKQQDFYSASFIHYYFTVCLKRCHRKNNILIF